VHVFQTLWDTRKYPNLKAVAKLVSVYKGKGPESDTGNYRGISAENVLTKLFSMMMCLRLYCRSELMKFLSRAQHGFRSRMRASDAILRVVNRIKRIVGQDRLSFALFIDFEKAFDRVPRDLLFRKLQRYGVVGQFAECLQDLYDNTTVLIAGDSDDDVLLKLFMGVLQGDPLSPLLFMLYTADLVHHLRSNDVSEDQLLIILFADDLTLIFEKMDEVQSGVRLLI
jgi:hypothetical protein